MILRDRLLALLRDPAYKPSNEAELARRLGISKRQRSALTHEVRLLLGGGAAVRLPGERIAPAQAAAGGRAQAQRGGAGRRQQSQQPQRQQQPQQQQPRGNRRPDRREEPQAPPAAATAVKADLTGRIQFRAGGSAFVVPETASGGRSTEPAAQIAPEETGVALPGDRVAVKIFPGVQGRRPGEPVGRVLAVLERGHETVIGNLLRGGRNFSVAPDDPRFVHEILVEDPSRSDLKPAPRPGDKVVVRLGEWKNRRQPITGTLVRSLGRTHEPQAELLGVLEKYKLDTQFPADVEREAAALPDHVLPRECANRLDYRSLPVFTIDPDDAKDFDDALSLETLPEGEVRVGVHIADVSTYVKPGTALDREAQRRGNSTYLVGLVIPMLPHKLSNGLCSLVEAQDRLCKAVFFTYAKNGRVKDTTYANTVIRSRKRLTYKQAHALLFENDFETIRALPLPARHQTGSTGRALRELGDTELTDLQSWLRTLWHIAGRLRRERMAHGSLDLDMPETKIYVDEQGYADRLERVEHDESHQLIEEFMLAANEAVARLTRTFRLPSLYRVHDDPDPEKLEEFQKFLATFGVMVGDLTRREEIVKLLETLRTHPQGYTLRTQLLRSLKKAGYRALHDGHYGLHKKDYTHFTSPIRRYSDLVVHRVFETYLIKHAGHPPIPGKVAYDIRGVENLAEHLSLTEINSTEAERESVKIKILEYFERQLAKKNRTPLAAVITDVRRHGFFIELVESMTFGFISAERLGDDSYLLNTSGTALVGRRKHRRYELGGRLDVVVDKVDRFKRLIDFRPAADK
jgi:ribonuclease R